VLARVACVSTTLYMLTCFCRPSTCDIAAVAHAVFRKGNLPSLLKQAAKEHVRHVVQSHLDAIPPGAMSEAAAGCDPQISAVQSVLRTEAKILRSALRCLQSG
jgi:hypothetical protein